MASAPATTDVFIPHPQYGQQGWVAVGVTRSQGLRLTARPATRSERPRGHPPLIGPERMDLSS